MSRLLAPTDWSVFRDATKQLLSDDSHTIEVRFRLQIETGPDVPNRGILYREMEGKGMLMIDQVDGQPSHTMWVIKPVGPPAYDQVNDILADAAAITREVPKTGEQAEVGEETQEASTSDVFSRPISSAVILCRICENNIPEWFFEKHNETCSDLHKFEADIGECNESINELRNTIRDLRNAVERSSPLMVPEYRGMPILVPATPPTSSGALQLFRPPLVSKMQRMSLRRMQKRLLEQLDDTLQTAYEVSLPSLKEEESKEPIERQRLLSPTSDRKMTQIRNWIKPSTEDPALARLLSDVERLMRAKMDNVVRMQNTIKYAEKVRQEWEEKMEQALQQQEREDEEDDLEEEEDDAASTTSEYAFGSDAQPSSGPTPLASTGLTPVPAISPASSSTSSSRRSQSPAPTLPGAYQAPGLNLYTRSSTPSSITSPLALAAPIVASDNENFPPSMILDDRINTLAHKKSQTLEPKVTITPPISPLITPQLSNSSSVRSRRLSTVNTMTSPGGGPLSPRIPSVVPSSRSTPTSIKDFEIIKPISKGAFGSVFLARKRVTGDYYAIKVLKKADMIAKNQITNVKAERMILMNQAESPFVAKLYFTFQSKENLYLVMEYLNGGDCAALIKSLGDLPEEWTRQYIAEVVLGLEYLHERGIVHR